MAGSIGIKQANGDFYSILEENSTEKKRLVLTTVHDNQKSVQIDLYRSLTKTMADAAYIGTLVIENIMKKPKGEPSIEMVLDSTLDGSITASAVDLSNPKHEHYLSVSLKSLEEDKNEYPDLDFDSGQEERNSPGLYERKIPWLVIIITGIILALLCLGLWFFLFRSKNSEPKQTAAAQTRTVAAEEPRQTQIASAEQPKAETPAQAPEEQKQAPPPKTAEPVPPPEQRQPVVVEAPPKPGNASPARVREKAPVYSFTVPEEIPREGIVYKIRWGDTLWDISEAFYRNPRFYPFIVRNNQIRNPGIIISGNELTILPRE